MPGARLTIFTPRAGTSAAAAEPAVAVPATVGPSDTLADSASFRTRVPVAVPPDSRTISRAPCVGRALAGRSRRARLPAERRGLRHRGLPGPRRGRRLVRPARRSRWSGCPTRACARAATGCAAPSGTPASSSRRTASPSTWRRPTCARRARRSTCRSRSASWPRPASSNAAQVDDIVLLGELSLDGGIHPTRGVLPIAAAAARATAWRRSCCPPPTRAKPRWSSGSRVIPVDSLAEAVAALQRAGVGGPRRRRRRAGRRAAGARAGLRRRPRAGARPPRAGDCRRRRPQPPAWSVRPGPGKTMMARRLPGILPPLTFDEALECTAIHSVAGCCRPASACSRERPFRAPHHTDLRRRAGRRRLAAAARRDQPGAPRRAVPRRDAGVRPARRSKCCASRSRKAASTIARAARTAVVPRAVHARRGDEPVPVRIPGRRAARVCRCTPPEVVALSRPALRAAARPDRPDRRRAGGARGDARRRGPGEASAADPRAGARGPPAPAAPSQRPPASA